MRCRRSSGWTASRWGARSTCKTATLRQRIVKTAMKRLVLLALLVLVAVAGFASVALADAHSSTRRAVAYAAEHSINLVLAGSPGDDRITIELSADGRWYEISSATPLEVAGTVCT